MSQVTEVVSSGCRKYVRAHLHSLLTVDAQVDHVQHLGKRLGQGASGEVVLSYTGAEQVAVKKIPCPSGGRQRDKIMVSKCCNLICDHPGSTELAGFCRRNSTARNKGHEGAGSPAYSCRDGLYAGPVWACLYRI
jgi:hypothetical protein